MIKAEALQNFCNKFRLTKREREVLTQLIQNTNLSSAEIAKTLGCSLPTVNVHLSNIFLKVGCRSKADVIRALMEFAAAFDENPLSGQSLVILSADDDPRMHEQLAQKARQAIDGRIQLVFCRNGQEVMMHLTRTKTSDPDFPRPDFILLDLQMPTMDGYETLRRIKADQHLKDIPVIVFSGTISTENTKEIYALGANSIVLKPASPEHWSKVIQTILQYWGL